MHKDEMIIMDPKYHLVMHEKHQDSLDAIMEYVSEVHILREDTDDLKERMFNLENLTSGISYAVKEHTRILGEHTRILEGHTRDLKGLKQDVGELKTDISELKQDIIAIKAAVLA